jgi:hypothetical protein
MLFRALFSFCLASVVGIVQGGTQTGHNSPVSIDEQSTASRQEMSYSASHLRLLIRYPGIYRISAGELTDAGIPPGKLQWDKVLLTCNGTVVPVSVIQGSSRRDSQSNPAGPTFDYLEFVGEAPRGTFSYYMPANLHNVYILSFEGDAVSPRYSILRNYPPAGPQPRSFTDVQHHEKDFYYTISKVPPGITDSFFWSHFKAGMTESFPVWLDFPGLDVSARIAPKLRFHIFSFTDVASLKPQHKFDLHYGDFNLGTIAFDGQRYFDFDTSVPISKIHKQLKLTFHTPPERENAVDWISLDSFEVKYPRLLDANNQNLFRFNNDLLSNKDAPVFTIKHTLPSTRVFCPSHAAIFEARSMGDNEIFVTNFDNPTTYVAVSQNGYYKVDSISYAQDSSQVANIPFDTNVLLLYNPKLATAADFYRRYRQECGLRVFAANVNDVFDELNRGFISADRLKKYIRYARQQAPGLTYLVLLGDSTVDYRESKHYDETTASQILIPIHWVINPLTTWTGGYPDDNWYGAFGAFNHPDIAVGRIPANTNTEAMNYLRKVIEYEQLRKSASDRALLVSSVEKSFQDLIRQTEARFSDSFSTVSVLFPETTVATREVANLRDQIDDGVQLLYYVGHGGAMVWRVGPTDYTRQKDLFTPTNVRQLTNKEHYPIVACSSCYTTSFDYDFSIGESFVLAPEKGSIAVIGTPWKSTVYEDHNFNKVFFEKYLDKNIERLGDAFLAAKRVLRPAREELVDTQSFTLLGDPCLKLVRK